MGYGYPICELDTRRPSFVTTKEFSRGTASTNTQPSKHALQPAGTPGLFSFISNCAKGGAAAGWSARVIPLAVTLRATYSVMRKVSAVMCLLVNTWYDSINLKTGTSILTKPRACGSCCPLA